MILLKEIAKLDSIISLLEGSFVVADLLTSLATDIWSVLWLSELESLVVVRSYAILIGPEHPNEGPVAPLFPLGFPAVVIDLDHDLVIDSLADVLRCPFSEFLDKVVFALLLIINCCFLKMINDPLVV